MQIFTLHFVQYSIPTNPIFCNTPAEVLVGRRILSVLPSHDITSNLDNGLKHFIKTLAQTCSWQAARTYSRWCMRSFYNIYGTPKTVFPSRNIPDISTSSFRCCPLCLTGPLPGIDIYQLYRFLHLHTVFVSSKTITFQLIRLWAMRYVFYNGLLTLLWVSFQLIRKQIQAFWHYVLRVHILVSTVCSPKNIFCETFHEDTRNVCARNA